MSNTLKFGNGEWYGKEGTILAYNDENNNYKPLPFNFDRDSVATRVNKQGLIETVGADQPRIDYLNDSNGALLLEPSRTNLVPYSNDFIQHALTGGSITSDDIVSPDGSVNADTFVEDTNNSQHKIREDISVTSGTYTMSCFVKGTDRFISFYPQGISTAYAVFDIANENVTASGGSDYVSSDIQNYGSGWYRCSLTYDVDTGTSYTHIYLSNSSTNPSPTYTGNGSEVSLYGLQLEQGSYPTSYIPTQGSAVTRLADSCLKEDINTSIINSSYPFSMYAESTYIGSNRYLLSFAKKTTSNNYYVITIISNEVILDARANGSSEFIGSGVTLVDGQKFKVAVTMENATSGKICVNGNTVVSKTNFSNQAVNNEINDLLLGQLRTVSDTGDRLPVTDVRLYNTALTDAELQALTQV